MTPRIHRKRCTTLHLATVICPRVGGVSALCFARERPITKPDHGWTVEEEDVTCRECRALIREEGA